jgi:hypothetical protein
MAIVLQFLSVLFCSNSINSFTNPNQSMVTHTHDNISTCIFIRHTLFRHHTDLNLVKLPAKKKS